MRRPQSDHFPSPRLSRVSKHYEEPIRPPKIVAVTVGGMGYPADPYLYVGLKNGDVVVNTTEHVTLRPAEAVEYFEAALSVARGAT